MIDLEKYRPRPGAPALTCRIIRRSYFCTQCHGDEQPADGPDAEVMYEIGPAGDEEMVCVPCARRIAGGEAALSRLVLDTKPREDA